MGCFDATCMVSNIGIGAGDPIVMLRIGRRVRKDKPKPGPFETPGVNMLYPGEEWSPIGLPFFGFYDDYGGIEDVERTPAVDFTVRLHNEGRGDKPFSLEDLCDREIDGQSLIVEDVEITTARTFIHRRIWNHLIHDVEYECWDRERSRLYTAKGLKKFQQSLAKAVTGEDSMMSRLYGKMERAVGDEKDELRKTLAEYTVMNAIRGGEGEAQIGGMTLFRENEALFLSDFPQMMALRVGMHLLRKSYLPLQTIGEQHSDDRRTKRFFEVCTAVVDDKLKDYEEDE